LNNPKIKTVFCFFSVFIFTAVILIVLNISFFSRISLLSGFEKLFMPETKLKNETAVTVDIDKRISSKTLSSLLYFINENSPDKIIIDVNFDNFSDYLKLEEITEFINGNDKIFGFLKLDDKKVFFKSNYNYEGNEDILRNFLFLKSDEKFSFANYDSDVFINNQLKINSSKIGAVYDLKDNSIVKDINALFKFDRKYLLSLSFLTLLKEKKILLNDVDFLKTKALAFEEPIIYYDQSGKSTFLNNINFSDNYTSVNFDSWSNYFNVREDLISYLIQLKLLSSDNSSFDNYLNEENTIETVYKISELKDPGENSKLSVSKNKAGEWKSFKQTISEKINNSTVIITCGKENKWIKDFMYEKKVINNCLNLFKIPLSVIFTTCVLFLFFILLLSVFIKNNFNFFILISSLIVLFIPINLILPMFFRISFPFDSFLSALLLGLLFGFALRFLVKRIWFNEVKNIYKSGISKENGSKIAELYKNNLWGYDSKSYIGTFGALDISIFCNDLDVENNVENIEENLNFFRNAIIKNDGIIEYISQNYISFYYGVPDRGNKHWEKSVETVSSIDRKKIAINEKPVKITAALYSGKDFFKLNKFSDDKSFIRYGNSAHILKSMILFAKKFNIDFVISDSLYKLNSLNLSVRMLDKLNIPDIQKSIRLFELITEDKKNDFGKLIEYFHAGLKLFELRKFEESNMYFKQCLKINPDDVPSKIYLNRCKEFINNPPEESWNFTFDL